ncbi:helix-turn-helix transcriptional regulator [Streptomyces griseoincarnatus]
MTTTEIAEEHGVSRQTVHAHRKRGVFPKPVEGEGSTRPRFRADEVAAFFAANPPSPGKRTDLAPRPQGEPVTTTTDPRIAILSALNDPPYNETAEKRCVPWDAAAELLDAYRADVLRAAADELEADDHLLAADELRRMADERPEAQDG